jgi:hypothetical protein
LPLVLTNGPCTLLSIIASSPVNNTANFFLYDAPTTNLTWTNASYNIITTIPTNTYITTWTNYYGATNYMTNRVVMEITNTIAGSTNYYNQPFYAVIPTNSTVTYNNLNIRFLNSLMLTNTNNSVLTFVYSFTQ